MFPVLALVIAFLENFEAIHCRYWKVSVALGVCRAKKLICIILCAGTEAGDYQLPGIALSKLDYFRT